MIIQFDTGTEYAKKNATDAKHFYAWVKTLNRDETLSIHTLEQNEDSGEYYVAEHNYFKYADTVLGSIGGDGNFDSDYQLRNPRIIPEAIEAFYTKDMKRGRDEHMAFVFACVGLLHRSETNVYEGVSLDTAAKIYKIICNDFMLDHHDFMHKFRATLYALSTQ